MKFLVVLSVAASCLATAAGAHRAFGSKRAAPRQDELLLGPSLLQDGRDGSPHDDSAARASLRAGQRPTEPESGGVDVDDIEITTSTAENRLDKMRKEELKQINKMRSIHRDMPKKLMEDFKVLFHTFMPTYQGITLAELVSNGILLLVGFGIIGVHAGRYYQNDRLEDANLFGSKLEAHQPQPLELEPDIMVVFHHPSCDQDGWAEKDVSARIMWESLIDKVGQDSMERPPSASTGSGKSLHEKMAFHFPSFMELISKAEQGHQDNHEKKPVVVEQLARGMSGTILPSTSNVTYREARLALLKDLYEGAIGLGWEAGVFSSVDDDEIYLCLSLRDFEDIGNLMSIQKYSLQLRRPVVQKLGINQPPEEPESSPPYIRYDPRIVQRLQEEVPELFDKRSDRPRCDIFRVYHDCRDREDGDIHCSRDRVRLLFETLIRDINLDKAVTSGMIVGWYPVHNTRWIETLKDTWSGSHNWTDLTFRQPVTLIKNYFGSRVAFSLAWIGHWCKMLVPLTIIAVLWEVFLLTALLVEDEAKVENLRRRLIVGFSIIIAVWARVASNMWDREEHFLMELFGNSRDAQQAARPNFKGKLEVSKIDLNKKEIRADMSKDFWYRAGSASFSLGFCIMVFLVMIGWIEFFDGKPGILAGIILSVQTVVFAVLFEAIGAQLTEMENHKYQNSFYDSYLWKQCLIYMVTNYTAFLYLAVKQKVEVNNCPPGGCLHALRIQIAVTLVILTFSDLAKSMVKFVKVDFMIRQEDSNLKKAKAKEGDASTASESDDEVPQRYWAEEQSKYPEYRIKEQVVNDCELLVALGFPILFGSITPIIVPCCLIVFMARMRSLSYFLTNFSRRPLPRRQFDMGGTRTILMSLTRVGVLFSATTLVIYNPSFQHSGPLTKLSNILVYNIGMEIIFLMVDAFQPKVSAQAEVLTMRRDYVQKELHRRVSGTTSTPGAAEQARARREMQNKDWSKVDHLEDLVRNMSGGDLLTKAQSWWSRTGK